MEGTRNERLVAPLWPMPRPLPAGALGSRVPCDPRGGGAARRGLPGQAIRVIDGDTLQIDGQLVQLYGIDAPELGQLCDRGGDLRAVRREVGAVPAQAGELGGAVGPLLALGSANRSGAAARSSGICEIGDQGCRPGHGAQRLRRRAAGAAFRTTGAEQQAREARLGLWHSDFVPPWEWREGRGAARASDWAARHHQACRAGGRAGLLRSDRSTNTTGAVDPRGRRRMFCSDEDARPQAGAGRARRPGLTRPHRRADHAPRACAVPRLRDSGGGSRS